MNDKEILLAFIALYLLGTLAIGWWASRFVKTTSDFITASRQMPMMIVVTEMFSDWFGSETVMGASSEFVEKGLLGVIEDPFGAALCLFIIGVFLARKLYNLNLNTFSTYFRNRFSPRAETVSALMMLPSYFGWISAQFIAIGLIINSISNFPVNQAIFICGFIVMLYTYIGGMYAIAYTDFIEAIFIIGGLVIILFIMLNKAGGIHNVVAHAPQGTFRFLPQPHFKNIIEYIAAWITVGLGSVPQQDVFQRIMSARTEKIAIRGAIIAAFMYLTIAMIPLIIALISTQLYPDLIKVGEKNQNLIPLMVLREGSLLVQILFFGALLSGIMSTSSSAILASSTVIGENLVRPFYKNMSDKKLLRIMRISVVGLTIIAAGIAISTKDIYELVGNSSRISLVSLFTPLIAGLYWKKATAWGAMSSMIIGCVVWMLCEHYQTEYPTIIYGLLASMASMFVFSYLERFFKKNRSEMRV